MLLAPLAFGLLVFLRLLSNGRGLRDAALLSLTTGMALVVGITEVLSLFGALTPISAGAVWTIAALAALLWSRSRLAAGASQLRTHLAATRLGRGDWLVAGALSVFVAGTAAAALLYPTVNYDSITAHMPRVFFWMQNGSVAHYPTPSGPQLFSGTTTAYVVLQLELLLGGSDRLVNLAGWLSYVFAVLAVTLLAKELGVSRRGQQVSALVAAAVPMAVLQASTTQTDITTALWCLTAVWALLRLTAAVRGAEPAAAWAVAAGVALGLAAGSKASALVILVPFGAWLYAALPRGRRTVLAAAVVLVTLTLNAGFYTRNATVLEGDPIGASAPGMSHILVKDRSPGALAITAVKNASMLLGTPSQRINEGIARAVRSVVAALGGSVDDSVNVETLSGPYRLHDRVLSHDVGPMPVGALLLLCSSLLVVATRREDGTPTVAYAACVLASFVLVAAVVNWNLFINRILLPPVILAVPLVAIAFDRLSARSRATTWGKARPWLAASLGSLLVLHLAWGGVVLLLNSTNRLLPSSLLPTGVVSRDVGWWNTSYHDLRYRILTPGLEAPAEAIARELAEHDAHEIGIVDHIGHTPVYALLAEMEDCSVHYEGESVIPAETHTGHDDAVIEFVPASEYDGIDSGTEYLLAPVYVPECDAYISCYCMPEHAED